MKLNKDYVSGLVAGIGLFLAGVAFGFALSLFILFYMVWTETIKIFFQI